MDLTLWPPRTFAVIVSVCAVGVVLGVWQFWRFWRKS